jgi:hypothetical protein
MVRRFAPKFGAVRSALLPQLWKLLVIGQKWPAVIAVVYDASGQLAEVTAAEIVSKEGHLAEMYTWLIAKQEGLIPKTVGSLCGSLYVVREVPRVVGAIRTSPLRLNGRPDSHAGHSTAHEKARHEDGRRRKSEPAPA